MANSYYEPGTPIPRFVTADATRINQELNAIKVGFDKLPSIAELNQGTRGYSAASGVVNAYTVTLPYSLAAYVAGMRIQVLIPTANTLSPTISLNGLPPVQIRRFDGTALSPGDLRAVSINNMTFDGVNFRLTSIHGSSELLATTSATSAAASASSASTSASQAANSALSAAGSAVSAAASASTATGAVSSVRFGMRNLLINTRWWVSQRLGTVTSGTSPAGTFIRDRWKAGATGVTWSLASGAITITAGSLIQVIAGRNVPFDSTYTLSWIGTATATVNGAAITNGGQIALTGYQNVTVTFFPGTLYLPQFEWGTVKTPYELRSTDWERAICEQYYQTSYLDFVTPGTPSGAGAYLLYAIATSYFSNGTVQLRTRMRGAPAITLYSTESGASGKIRKDAGGVDINYFIDNLSDTSFVVVAVDANATVGGFCRCQWTADAEL